MKRRMHLIRERILDALTPLASLAIGLAFLWSWRQRRRRFEQEWTRASKDDEEDISSS